MPTLNERMALAQHGPFRCADCGAWKRRVPTTDGERVYVDANPHSAGDLDVIAWTAAGVWVAPHDGEGGWLRLRRHVCGDPRTTAVSA